MRAASRRRPTGSSPWPGPAHATTFTVEVALAGRPPQTASAATKRAAERAAAAMMLERIAAG